MAWFEKKMHCAKFQDQTRQTNDSLALLELTVPATFLILQGVQNASERSVVPASLPIAMAREPLNQPSRFGLTSAPQAL
jgi:hypothetical protein